MLYTLNTSNEVDCMTKSDHTRYPYIILYDHKVVQGFSVDRYIRIKFFSSFFFANSWSTCRIALMRRIEIYKKKYSSANEILRYRRHVAKSSIESSQSPYLPPPHTTKHLFKLGIAVSPFYFTNSPYCARNWKLIRFGLNTHVQVVSLVSGRETT